MTSNTDTNVLLDSDCLDMINKAFEAKLKEEEQNTGWLLIVKFFFLSSCQFWWKVKSLFFYSQYQRSYI